MTEDQVCNWELQSGNMQNPHDQEATDKTHCNQNNVNNQNQNLNDEHHRGK
jgi:hypothetical protein